MLKKASLMVLTIVLSFGLLSPTISNAALPVDEPTRAIEGPPPGSSCLKLIKTYAVGGDSVSWAGGVVGGFIALAGGYGFAAFAGIVIEKGLSIPVLAKATYRMNTFLNTCSGGYVKNLKVYSQSGSLLINAHSVQD
jgi:hypothetical protein